MSIVETVLNRNKLRQERHGTEHPEDHALGKHRHAAYVKLNISGMYSRSLGHCRRSVGAKIPIHAAPTELGRASGVVVTINMALLTELDPSPPPKMRIRSSSKAAPPSEFRQDAASRLLHFSTHSFLAIVQILG
jgi:hypothetical protein